MKDIKGVISMDTFEPYLSEIKHSSQATRVKEILDWIHNHFPALETRIAWGYPHFVHKGTFILALSVAKEHVAIAPEKVAVDKFRHQAEMLGYATSQQLIKIKWNQPVNFCLLQKIIEFNLDDKKGYKT